MVTYLNHAGTSWPKPASVWEAHDQARDAPWGAWSAMFERAHDGIARAFGTTPDRVLPTPGCTQAIATAVHEVALQPGDRVLTSALEHQALAHPLAQLAAQGVTVLEIRRSADGPLDLEHLEAALRRGSVRLVAMSMACNVTGERLPWPEVVALAHAHGALCLLDGAQVAGWVPLDLPALGVDYFAFAGHKGPQAPTGIGGLYVGESHERPSYCSTGSVALPALCGLAAGLEAMHTTAPLERAGALEVRFRQGVAALPGVRVLGDGPRMPTCCVRIGQGDPGEQARVLAGKGVVANGSMHCAPRAHATLGTSPGGALRFSFGPASTDADVDRAIREVQSMVPGSR